MIDIQRVRIVQGTERRSYVLNGREVGVIDHGGGTIWWVMALCGLDQARDHYAYCFRALADTGDEAQARLLDHLASCPYA